MCCYGGNCDNVLVMLSIVINLVTNKCVRTLGKVNIRNVFSEQQCLMLLEPHVCTTHYVSYQCSLEISFFVICNFILLLFVGGECSVLKHFIIPGEDTEN